MALIWILFPSWQVTNFKVNNMRKILLSAAIISLTLTGCVSPISANYAQSSPIPNMLITGDYVDSSGNELHVSTNGAGYYCQPSLENLRPLKFTKIDGQPHAVGKSNRALPIEQGKQKVTFAGNAFNKVRHASDVCNKLNRL